jgi:hypothetical protein
VSATRRHVIGLALLALCGPATVVHADAPVISLWYRGGPGGVPVRDDLALIRALGFHAVSWPSEKISALPSVRGIAQTVGLQVVVEPDDPVSAGAPVVRMSDRLRIRTDRVRPDDVPALVWAAVATGTRLISFDTGEPTGHGLTDATGQERGWVRAVVACARQVWGNAMLLGALQPGPAVAVESGASPAVVARLFAVPRTWVIIAANTGRAPADLVVRLPASVPYALWSSLIDDSTMSMLSEPAGPRWTVRLAAGQAAVYLTDR